MKARMNICALPMVYDASELKSLLTFVSVAKRQSNFMIPSFIKKIIVLTTLTFRISLKHTVNDEAINLSRALKSTRPWYYLIQEKMNGAINNSTSKDPALRQIVKIE